MTYNVWVINDLWLKINFLICFLLKLNLLCAVSSFILGFRLTNELALWLAVQQTIEERARWLFICSRENVSGQTENGQTEHNTVQSATWDIGCIQGWFSIVCEVESSQERQVENGSKMRNECVVIMFVCSS